MEIFEKAAMVIAAVVIVLVYCLVQACADWLRRRKGVRVETDDSPDAS
jgi:amino acid transporter